MPYIGIAARARPAYGGGGGVHLDGSKICFR